MCKDRKVSRHMYQLGEKDASAFIKNLFYITETIGNYLKSSTYFRLSGVTDCCETYVVHVMVHVFHIKSLLLNLYKLPNSRNFFYAKIHSSAKKHSCQICMAVNFMTWSESLTNGLQQSFFRQILSSLCFSCTICPGSRCPLTSLNLIKHHLKQSRRHANHSRLCSFIWAVAE